MDMNQYLDIFIEESKEHLQYMNENLLNLEKDPNSKDLLNEIFRIAHTLKGMAGTMGFSKVARLTHEMENLLHAIRNNELSISTKIIDVLFECFDTLDEYVSYIGANGEEGDLDSSQLAKTLSDILHNSNEQSEITVDSSLNQPEENINEYILSVVSKAKEKGLNTYNLFIKLSDSCMLKSARAFIIFNTLESFSEIIQSNPSVEDIEDEKFDNTFTLVIVTEKGANIVKKEIMSISEIDEVRISEVKYDEKVLVTNNDHNKGLSEVSLKESDEENSESQNKKKQGNIIGKTVRVDIDRLDNLMNLVSELIIIKTRMEDMSSTSDLNNMNEAIEYLERITTNLHDAVMKVRMVPIERVFNRFPRMVRDLAKELGKEINLEMSGEETEVDRTVIDEIGDPLIHLLRNSIDHGIENPEIRLKAGKTESGTVKLKAYPDGNNVVIEVGDDGDGIDIEKVKRKAIEKGLITESKANELSKEESIDLLFKAGFSTADKISDVSGRGVGLDVVKTKIESIGGIVEVESNKGKGTKFIIRIPLTLAIIQALLINLSEEIYAIPLSSISEITTILSKDIRKVQNQEVVLYRNKTLPLIRLNTILGIADNVINNELTVVIVKKGDKEAGLIVDNLIGQQEIVIKSLGKYLAGIKYLAGATILGNGKISLILDVNSLF